MLPTDVSSMNASYRSPISPAAGPSSFTESDIYPSSSHTANGRSSGISKSNGFTSTPTLNGNATASEPPLNGFSAGTVPSSKASGIVKRVNMPGTMLYDDGSDIDRQEYIRILIQSLRDVGYAESAATLEAESGYIMEVSEVSQFRQNILEGNWDQAISLLHSMGIDSEEILLDVRFLIGQQKYLEALEAGRMSDALQVLRNDLAGLDAEPEQLNALSSLLMCNEPEDLRSRAEWTGAAGDSRQKLLDILHRYIPSSIMIPRRRMANLITQARAHQYQHCLYHNMPSLLPQLTMPSQASSRALELSHPIKNQNNHGPLLSLFSDHYCDRSCFPRVTSNILGVHTDEVWQIEWSHDGKYLASASKDQTAIIWEVGSASDLSRQWRPVQFLRNHGEAVGCIAWSMDDSLLLTAAEKDVRIWNAKTGICTRGPLPNGHTEPVTAMEWLPEGSSFLTASLDRSIIQWDEHGNKLVSWGSTPIRIIDIAITPDLAHVVAIGMEPITQSSSTDGTSSARVSAANIPNPTDVTNVNWMHIFSLASRKSEFSTRTEGELTSVKITPDSRHALVNQAPDEIHLFDLKARRVIRRYMGQRQGQHIIRSCFGGPDSNFVVSGSEDGYVYIWHRDTGDLLEVLPGHGEGSVNCVAWNPRNQRMFASCSDDSTVRIWEAPASLPIAVGKGKGKPSQT